MTVRHYPPGASKWNPIEHHLFSQISKSWSAKNKEAGTYDATWILLSRRGGLDERLDSESSSEPPPQMPAFHLWTDDYINLPALIKTD